MKIGIDAKWFYTGNPSGRVVVRNLVEQIVQNNTEHELYIFLDRRDKGKPFPYEDKKVHLKYVWADLNMLSNLFLIPLVAYPLHLDAFVFQYFAPLISNFKRYSFVHCVLFKSNPEFFTYKELVYFLPIKLGCRMAHGICTVSQSEKSKMVKYGFGRSEKIDVVYHGVDEKFKPMELRDPDVIRVIRDKYNLPDTYLLYVGRLNIVKNIPSLIRSLPRMRNKIPLVVVGDYDWKMTKLDGLVKELGLDDRVVFTGPVYGDDLSCIYSAATVFCFPSFDESFGLPALEAMSSGVPVIVSDRSSFPEICGEAGTYIDPDSPADIAEKIDGLLDDPALYRHKRELALARARQFRWESSARELVRHVARLCAR